MFKSFLIPLGLSVWLLSAVVGCTDRDAGQSVAPGESSSGRTSHTGAPGTEFNPYDQQPNQTAVDNN